MVEEELAKANAKMYSKEIERLQMAVKDTKENADAIIIEQQEEIERLSNELQVQIEDNTRLNEYIEAQENIIKEAREYIDKELDIEKICKQEKSLTICKKELLEILDKGEEIDGV